MQLPPKECKNEKKLICLLTLCLFAAACRSYPTVYEVKNRAVTVAEGQTLRQAILQAGRGRRWMMHEVKPGLIQGVLNVRGHEVVVNIPYTQDSFSIEYVSSENMRYNPKKNRIHRKYKQWVRNLEVDIYRFAQM